MPLIESESPSPVGRACGGADTNQHGPSTSNDHRYRIYGLIVQSSVPMLSPLPVGMPNEQAQVRVSWRFDVQEADAGSLETNSTDRVPAIRFVVPGIAAFRVTECTIQVDVYANAAVELAEVHVLGTALALCAELRGFSALHASAVVIRGGAVAFLGTNRSGKTAIAAAFMRAGHALLSDDILTIDGATGSFIAQPGYRQMRMWDDNAQHFLGERGMRLPYVSDSHYRKRRVLVGPHGGFGTFHAQSSPLSAMYLLRRRQESSDVSPIISHIRPSQAAVEIVRQNFVSVPLDDRGAVTERLRRMAMIVETVPVRAISFRSGYSQLDSVLDSIRNDLAQQGLGLGRPVEVRS